MTNQNPLPNARSPTNHTSEFFLWTYKQRKHMVLREVSFLLRHTKPWIIATIVFDLMCMTLAEMNRNVYLLNTSQKEKKNMMYKMHVLNLVIPFILSCKQNS